MAERQSLQEILKDLTPAERMSMWREKPSPAKAPAIKPLSAEDAKLIAEAMATRKLTVIDQPEHFSISDFLGNRVVKDADHPLQILECNNGAKELMPKTGSLAFDLQVQAKNKNVKLEKIENEAGFTVALGTLQSPLLSPLQNRCDALKDRGEAVKR